MAATTASLPPTLADLSGLYEFRDPADVAHFLQAHPHLVPLLVEARPMIDRIFGPDVPIRLQVVYDPDQEEEDDEDLTQVFAFVRTGPPWQEARRLLARFDREWWLANTRRSDGRLQFDVWF